MKPLRIFISSVQQEFAAERAALRDYLTQYIGRIGPTKSGHWEVLK